MSRHTSIWIGTTHQTSFSPLNGNRTADVAIIGGGMAGLLTATLLKEKGFEVMVVESNRIAEGVSGHTTAKVTSLHGLQYHYLTDQFGREKAQQYADANQEGLKLVTQLAKQHPADYETRRAYTYAQTDEELTQVKEEVTAAKKLGLPATFTTKTELPIDVKGSVTFSRQAQIHPRKFLLSLAQSIEHIYEHTRAVNIKGNTVITEKGNVIAKYIVIATNAPFYDTQGLYAARIYASRSYVLTALTEEEPPVGMHVSAGNGHSYRSQPLHGKNALILGGEDHPTGGDTSKRYSNLKKHARKHFTVKTIPYYWSTQDVMTPDRIPYIGQFTPLHKNVFIATGFNKWGMSTSAAAAIIIAKLIAQEDTWDVFSPTRVKILPTVRHNIQVGRQWIKDKFEKPDKRLPAKGEGKLVEARGKTIAAYRDKKNQLHKLDATCTHLGCNVRWNSAEGSWDCPCHGSRFSIKGEVLHGPAIKNLKPA